MYIVEVQKNKKLSQKRNSYIPRESTKEWQHRTINRRGKKTMQKECEALQVNMN